MKETITRLTNNKTLLRTIWAICLVLFVVLFIRYKKYKPMKIDYNNGVRFFKMQDYEMAEAHFVAALYEKKTKSQECKIRINLALSIVTPITPDSVTPENLEENIERLEYARDILIENDCAHDVDSNGHNEKAQRLKEEIDEYIEKLKEQNPPPEEQDEKKDGQNKEESGSKDSANKDNANNDGTQNQDDIEKQKLEEEKRLKQEEEARKQNEKQQELKEAFKQIEQEGLTERNNSLAEYESWGSFDYGSGKNW